MMVSILQKMKVRKELFEGLNNHDSLYIGRSFKKELRINLIVNTVREEIIRNYETD